MRLRSLAKITCAFFSSESPCNDSSGFGGRGGGVRVGGGAHFRAEGAVVVGPSPHPQPPGLALFLGRRAGSPSSRAPSPVASPILSRLAPLLSLTDAWEDPVRQVPALPFCRWHTEAQKLSSTRPGGSAGSSRAGSPALVCPVPPSSLPGPCHRQEGAFASGMWMVEIFTSSLQTKTPVFSGLIGSLSPVRP